MTRRNRSPEENERRAKIRELLQAANIGNMKDIQELFKETIAEFMENGLEAELDNELGYSKYDYKSKNADNSRNGHSEKTLRTSFGNVGRSVPRDRNSEFEPQLLKKNQTSISQDIEEKIISMYAKGISTDDISDHVNDIYGISVLDTTISRITKSKLPAKPVVCASPIRAILPAALNELESPPTAPLSRAAPKGAYRESFLPALTGLPVNGSTGSNKLSWSA